MFIADDPYVIINMIININGNVNRYYVQTLCMIFFPGAGFSENADNDEK